MGISMPTSSNTNATEDDTTSTATTAVTSNWTLAEAIRLAGERGFFVHLRLGPYICAEVSYGGIPEWLPDDTIALRRPDLTWMRYMEDYIRNVLSYLQESRLFAHQGGPIVLGQVENELGEKGKDEDDSNWAKVTADGKFVAPTDPIGVRRATIQDYANWSADLVKRLEPHIVWTMCFGVSAPNTINTYNGFFNNPRWLENGGGNGRIQKDQPAMWSENEGTKPLRSFIFTPSFDNAATRKHEIL